MSLRRKPLWILPNLLSLDAPLIAVVWQGFLARAFDIPLGIWTRLALWLAVWAIYLGDRLLDARKEPQPGEPARHRFYRDHQGLAGGLLAAALVGGAIISVLCVPRGVFSEGLVIGAGVLAYLLIVHGARRWFAIAVPKEFAVALLFTAGTLTGPWAAGARHPALEIAFGGMFLACVANSVAIEHFEWSRLRKRAGPPPHAITRWFGNHYGFLVAAFAVIAGVMALRASRPGLSYVLSAVMLALAVLLLLHLLSRRLSPDSFRVLTDAALLSPAAVWLWLVL